LVINGGHQTLPPTDKHIIKQDAALQAKKCQNSGLTRRRDQLEAEVRSSFEFRRRFSEMATLRSCWAMMMMSSPAGLIKVFRRGPQWELFFWLS